MAVYLDYAGGAPILEVAREARVEALKFCGSPSSLHSEGRRALALLDRARDIIADVLDVERRGLVFTSSGTEAINLAFFGLIKKAKRFMVGAADHNAVIAVARQLRYLNKYVFYCPVDRQGHLNISVLVKILQDFGPSDVVSITFVNNEVGTQENVVELCKVIRAVSPCIIHVDMCQGIGFAVKMNALPDADMISVSGSKVGAGCGIGVFWAKQDLLLDPIIYGGPQEGGRRAGREPLDGAYALARALEWWKSIDSHILEQLSELETRIRQYFESSGLRFKWTGDLNARMPGIVSMVVHGINGEDMIAYLDMHGICISSGSACASGSLDPSHVLLAMGFDTAEASSSLRISFGPGQNFDEVERGAKLACDLLCQLQQKFIK